MRTKINLTVKQLKLKEKISSLKEEIRLQSKKLEELKKNCKHVIPFHLDADKDEFYSVSPRCSICDELFDEWYCKESPDRVCHYFTFCGNGKDVELIDGRIVKLEHGSDPMYECDDNCLFCGMPNERK